MFKEIIFQLIEDILRHVSGPLGFRLRRWYYQIRLQSCGEGLVMDTGVHIQNPGWVSLGTGVWIDKNVILLAGPATASTNIRTGIDPKADIIPGTITIGSNCHLGIATIIQGHSGVAIGDSFTSSAQVAIYSYSNDPYQCRTGTLPGSTTYYVSSPVRIGTNTWLGLGVYLIGAELGHDTFVKSNSIVTGVYPNNVVLAGSPAKVIQARFQ